MVGVVKEDGEDGCWRSKSKMKEREGRDPGWRVMRESPLPRGLSSSLGQLKKP